MSELTYPHDEHVPAGTTQEVAPGVRWLTMPMGGSLTHINLYLLEDHDGWYVVDTGLRNEQTHDLWHQIFDEELGGKPVKGVICTHMHPDHTGMAGMITEHFHTPLYMTRAEFYQARSCFGGTHPNVFLEAGIDREVFVGHYALGRHLVRSRHLVNDVRFGDLPTLGELKRLG